MMETCTADVEGRNCSRGRIQQADMAGRMDGLLNEWTDGWMGGWFKPFVIY